MRNLLYCLLLMGCHSIPNDAVIAIQPLGQHQQADVTQVASVISQYYGFQTVILPADDIPDAFFVNVKSPRYRADSIIRFLRDTRPDSVDYVIGLTSHDISITKRGANGEIKSPPSKYGDWGIFGLGFRPGRASVVSMFRLGSNSQLRSERLQKITLHELGHNLGLPHCDSLHCVMRDAAEMIRTIDEVEMGLCKRCWHRVH